jgi:hypothetical protein
MNRRALLTTALLSVALLCPLAATVRAASPDEAAVAQAFEALRGAVRSGDGKKLLGGLSRDSLARLEAVRTAARRPGADGKLSPVERLAAAGLRRTTTPADLNRKSLDDIAAAAFQRHGAFGRDADKASLGPLRVNGERAGAPLLVDGQPTLFSADFVRESGAWKLDLRPSLKRADMLLIGMAAMKGTSEDALIETILSQTQARMRKAG